MIQQIDESVLLWIQENLRSDLMTVIMRGITFVGDKGVIWIAIGIVLLCWPRYRRQGLLTAIALITSVLVCNILIKNIVCRPRPYDTIEELILIGKRMSDYSFPSGHTSAAFATGVIYLRRMRKRFGVPMFVLAFLMMFSRIYLGVHYLSDILVGAIIGVAIALIVLYIDRKIGYDEQDTARLDEVTGEAVDK